ncbi:hypothetical protein D3C86_2132240 [compost metagenome]
MQGGDQADRAEGDHADALDDAQRARLQADHMFEVERGAHQCQATEKTEKEQGARAGQRHGISEGGWKRWLR